MKARDRKIRQLRTMLEPLGWRYVFTGTQHHRFIPPAGQPVGLANTPSEIRGDRNAVAALRRAGAPLPRGFKL